MTPYDNALNASRNLSAYLVTVEEYNQFCVDSTRGPKEGPPGSPVTRVSYDDAMMYIMWLNSTKSCNARLPYEFELAAAEFVNCAHPEFKYVVSSWPHARVSDAYTASKGLPFAGTTGVVYQWCADQAGSFRVSRGGSWDSSARDVRAAFRNWLHPGVRVDYLGFRLAFDPIRAKTL